MSFPWFSKQNKHGIEIVEAMDGDEDEEEFEDEDDSETTRETIQEQVFEWAKVWAQTPGFEALPANQKDQSEFITESFTSYMYDYHDVTPDQWNASDMQDCCLQTLPRKISTEEVYYRSLAPVLDSFFTFLGETRRQHNGLAMARRIRGLGDKIVAASNNPRNWGFAKQFVMAAQGRGVDVTDDAQMQSFTAEYNAEMLNSPISPPDDYVEERWTDYPAMEVPYVREGPKVGRNDPCPCGSGKKYKKCCGAGV